MLHRLHHHHFYSVQMPQINFSVVVSMAIIVTLFGASVVYLLMAAQIIEQLLLTLIPTLTICTWYLIVVGAMTPLIFFNSPKDLT